ncbi:MAG TPA: phosphate ABC transporter permease PstA [Alphaproteobacteria bacterium]|jgi:phosphate transport system permease protein|nr:phosphate ABC transporter permease PstA [Alphaproteobacteria bacterium]
MDTSSVAGSQLIVHKRLRTNRIVTTLAFLATGAGLFLLAWILGYLLFKGFTTLSFHLLTMDTPPPGSAGGLANAILGSLLITGIGIGIATPIGILAGTYLIEYGRGSKLAEVIRFVNDMLVSAPSIIVGLFVYQVVVAPMHHFSAWAGAISLAIIALPIIVRTTQDMLQLVPDALREAAYALGAPKWRVIVVVSYRAAFQGMLTGVLLAVARISGETAPLLFTALSNPSSTTNMSQPMATLPVVIYKFAGAPYKDWQDLAWAGALLITFSVLILNVVARSFAPRRN